MSRTHRVPKIVRSHSPLTMKSCAYCGKENEDAVTACVECGTESFKTVTTAMTIPAGVASTHALREPPIVNVQYKNTLADVLWLQAYTFYRSPVMIAIYAGFCGFACFDTFTFTPASAPLGARILATAVVVSVCSMAFFLLCGLFTALLLISKSNKTIFTQHTITITENCLIAETEFNRTEQKWTGIPRLARTRRHIFAYGSQYAAHVIPRRAFADAAAWDSFYHELQSRVQRSG